MSKRCELKKEYYKEFFNYKGAGKYSDDYVRWLESQVLTFKEKANAIKEVIKWIELGKQDINNGFKEIDFILNKNKDE
jgi:hypothetical protein